MRATRTAERAGLAAGQVRRLKLKWAIGFPGDVTAFAAPTVVNGTLFVGSASGAVEAVDAKTGCTHWVFQANGPVRAAILPVPSGSDTSLVFTDLIGWAYALDAKSGKLLWKKRIDEHEATRLTGSSVALNGRGLYSGCVVGRNAFARSAICVLHVSRQRFGASRSRRVARLEDVHWSIRPRKPG